MTKPIGLNDVTRILLHYEIEACEKRLEHYKKHGSVLDRWFGTEAITRKAYEDDLTWLREKAVFLGEAQ